ncbi:MAG: hypothetical protein U5L11_12715 [Arhodomonas sp.]|nr:hypothetical protein [Arhodomonas sp.]
MGDDDAVLGLLEEVLEGVELAARAEPAEVVAAPVELWLEPVLVVLADAAVDAVGGDDQVAVG